MIVFNYPYNRLKSLFQGDGPRTRSMRATVLTAIAFGGSKIMQLGSNLLLTRILFPEAFGLMTLVFVFIGALHLMSDVGVQASIIRSARGNTPEFLETAWTVMVVRGFWITGLAFVFAWPYAHLYGHDILFPLICVASLSTIAQGFASIERTVRARDLDLGRVVSLDLLGQGIGICLTVMFAWLTQSVWGLAIGAVAGAIIATALSHVLLPSPNNRFRWDRDVLSEIMVFGRWILLGTLFTYMGGEGLRAINGYLVDIDTLAFLYMASMIGGVPGQLTGKILSNVAFPTLSRIVRERPDDLKFMVHKIRMLQVVFSIPIFLLIAVIAQPLIDFLYDPRYAAAGTFLAVMALNGAVGTLPMVYQSALLSQGESRAHAFVMGVSSALKIAGTICGFYLGGPVGMILGDGVAMLFVFCLSFAIARGRKYASFRLDAACLVILGGAYAYVLSTIDWTI
ncbi:oligosaccharide flippase family protein [Rhodobacteraceae bacterium F11138]|nr:oligosaccharide flippase family protein [Rhodobacteraceae bacterium F11138]